MKKFVMNESGEVHISAVDFEAANLNEWERLELHLLDQAAVVIPGEMTVMEVIRTAELLQGLAFVLLAAIGEDCERGSGCVRSWAERKFFGLRVAKTGGHRL